MTVCRSSFSTSSRRRRRRRARFAAAVKQAWARAYRIAVVDPRRARARRGGCARWRSRRGRGACSSGRRLARSRPGPTDPAMAILTDGRATRCGCRTAFRRRGRRAARPYGVQRRHRRGLVGAARARRRDHRRLGHGLRARPRRRRARALRRPADPRPLVGRRRRRALAAARARRNPTSAGTTGQTGIVATIAHERDHEGLAEQHFLPAGPFAILPMPGRFSRASCGTSATPTPRRLLALAPEDSCASSNCASP